jgi:hypothetical protein
MNDKLIAELACKANMTVFPSGLKEFAELIIQECIRLGEESQYKCRTFPVSVAIKDHFGIK